MKISTYTPVASASITLPSGHASASANINAYGGKTDTSALDNLMKFATKIQEDRDAQSAFNAMNDYNEQMNNLLYNKENGLMHLEGSAADNVGQTYAEAEKKIRSKVLSDHKVMMRGANVALNNSLERLNVNNGRNVMLHETKQFEVAKVNNLNKNIDTASKAAQSNYSDYENVRTQADMVAMQARETFKYKGEEAAEAEAKKAQANIYKAAMGTALQQENFGSFEELLLQGGEYLDAQDLSKYKQVAFVKQRSKFESEMAQKALAVSGGDMKAAEAWLKEQDGFYSDHNTGKMSEESVSRVLREMGGLITEQRRVARGQSRAAYSAGTSAIDQMLEEGVSFQDAIRWARANDNGSGKLEKLVRSRYKSAGNEGSYYDERTFREMLRRGQFKDEWDVEDWVAYQGFTDKERKLALKEFDNYSNRKGAEFGIKWDAIKKDYGYNKMSGRQQIEFDYAIERAKRKLIMGERYGEYDKRDVDDFDGYNAVEEALEKKVYHEGGLFGGENKSISNAKLDKLGVDNLWYDEENDRVIIDRNGTVENMSQEEFSDFAGSILNEGNF